MRLGIALSGGGHRASVWGVGVLAAVVDAGLGGQVESVSSVSGGSITNGVVAQNVDLRTADAAAFDAGVRDALRSFACDGLFPNGPLTSRYFGAVKVAAGLSVLSIIAFVAGVAGLGRDTGPWWYLLVGVLVAAVAMVLGASAKIALAVGVAAGVVAFGAVAATTYVNGWAAGSVALALGLVVVIAWTWLLTMVARRGAVARSAIARTHFGGTRRTPGTRLADVDRAVNHVFLTTDLEAGDQFYLAPRFLYGYREGIADPDAAGTTVAEAVQASAALPGGFPPVTLATGTFRRPWDVSRGLPARPPERVVLSDGGVYDNMADQWEGGIDSRLRRWPELSDIQQPADVLIVANSSAGWDWQPFDARGWLGRELLALRRVQGVQYDVSTSRRRRSLMREWRADGAGGDEGIIVMIDRSPYRLADGFARWSDERGERAREAVAFLGDTDADRDRWAALAASNAGVATVLDALDVEPTLDLLEHAYVSTLVGLYVTQGLGRLAPFPRERFERLISTG